MGLYQPSVFRNLFLKSGAMYYACQNKIDELVKSQLMYSWDPTMVSNTRF